MHVAAMYHYNKLQTNFHCHNIMHMLAYGIGCRNSRMHTAAVAIAA